jgi:predicted ATP-dependent endonuclease of OLD family
MKEKLIIKNFGPIRHVELELGRFNVLIGEQATGKSTVAKLLAVCRYFSYIVNWKDTSISTDFYNGLAAWGLEEAITAESSIYYQNTDYKFEARSYSEKLNLTYGDGTEVETSYYRFFTDLFPISDRFKKLLDELNKIKPVITSESIYNPEDQSLFWSIPSSFLHNDVAWVMSNPFYLPAERGLQSIFSLGKSSIQNLSDSLFNQFARIDQVTRLFKNETAIDPLNIIYKNIEGQGYIKKTNESNFFSLFNAATGYQSAIPVVLLTKYYSDLKKKVKTFIIEEPELNLFPSAQQKLMQYLVSNVVNHNHSMLLTTHSPYVLTSLNNMIYAHKVGQVNAEGTKGIVPGKYWLNLDEVSVYMMLPDGTCEDIIDKEEGLIKADKIDAISGVLNKEFDALLNLEFAGNEPDTK